MKRGYLFLTFFSLTLLPISACSKCSQDTAMEQPTEAPAEGAPAEVAPAGEDVAPEAAPAGPQE